VLGHRNAGKVAIALHRWPLLMNNGTRKRGIGITLAVVVMLSPSGMGRMVVLVVSVLMILQRSGQNQACKSAKSFGVSV